MNPTPPGGTTRQRLISPEHLKVRRVLRAADPIIPMIGILFTATAFVSFVSTMGNHSGPPKLFWCGFIGLPLMFLGTVLCLFGFIGAFARYTVAEQAPVAADTINYLADQTQEGVRTVSKDVAQGVAQGIRAAGAKGTDA